MRPVKEPVGWQDPDYFCWGGLATIAPGEEGAQTAHFFGARWPRWTGFLGWLTHSEICRATSASPTGPFTTREIVLGPRVHTKPDGTYYWDQHNAHNPTLLRWKGKLCLFYTGTHRDPANPFHGRNIPVVPQGQVDFYETGHYGWPRMHQRVGVAIADSPLGPWTRFDAPLLEPDEAWAPFFTTNPSACANPHNGKIHLYYKSVDSIHKRMKLGVATADRPEGPYLKYTGNPIIDPGPHHNVEDHFVWVQAGRFHMLFKDMTGGIGGLPNATVELTSDNGLDWDLRTARILYTPGWPTSTGWQPAHRMEQCNLLLAPGDRPAVLYASVLNTDERWCPGHPGHQAFVHSQREHLQPLREQHTRNIAISLDFKPLLR